jgi:excinuclease ABC subunit A
MHNDPIGPTPGYVTVRGAREHNLRDVDVDVPRDALVVFTGVSGSGKSSLVFATLYAEAQRRYLESVAPYARRLFDQLGTPDVDSVEGMPPAIALQQQRGTATPRSSVGGITTISNLVRMLYSRAGQYPRGADALHADDFSANTPSGACPACRGQGQVHTVTERSLVPDPSLSIREGAISAWPVAWHGQNLRDIAVTLGFDIDVPFKSLEAADRRWLLFTEEQPQVPVYAGFSSKEVKQAMRRKDEPSYMGTFTSAKRHVLHTYANSSSVHHRRRAAAHLISRPCKVCDGKRLRRDALQVKFAGIDIADFARLPVHRLNTLLGEHEALRQAPDAEHAAVIGRIVPEMQSRLRALLDLGLGYLTLERVAPTLSPGELQRLRLATQIHSNLFGVVYVLDEPSAGLHPADTEALLRAFTRLIAAGNSLFVVEHELDVIRRADWVVDVGPGAGQYGGNVLYSGPVHGLQSVHQSATARHLFSDTRANHRSVRTTSSFIELRDVTCNNIEDLSVSFPIGMLTTVTGVSGSGKSSLVTHALTQLVGDVVGREVIQPDPDEVLTESAFTVARGSVTFDSSRIKRLVQVDQRPIGRTPRSNLATYTGLFDMVRRLFAETPLAKSRRYTAGRFSFNVAKGRCARCEGQGAVFVELLFLPGVYAPCPECGGSRYNAQTLDVRLRDKTIADVLHMTVDEAATFFSDDPLLLHALVVLQEVGLGYLRLGQPATELSGGEAQRIKLARELKRVSRGSTLYVLDEPTTGLHPQDVDRLLTHLHQLVDAGNTVVMVEHDMFSAASSDWIIDLGPGAGEEGGQIVATGTPGDVAQSTASLTAPYLAKHVLPP